MRAASTVALVAALAAAAPAQEPPKPADLLVAVEKQLRAAAETAGPCVGCVVVSRSDRYPKPVGPEVPGRLGAFDLKEFVRTNAAPGDARAAATLDLSDPKNILNHGFACGVVIDPSGLLLTPYHVIDGATKVYVHLPGKAGSYADVHAADARYDLAVLKLISPPPGLTAIKFADVQLDARPGRKPTVAAGSLAVVVSNAHVTGFAPDRPSAALAVVGRVQAPASEGNDPGRAESYYSYGPRLELDTRLVPAPDGARGHTGTAGAAVLNLDGQMIGLTTAVAGLSGERGPLYAFPADSNFRRVVEVLRRGEEVEYGFLGVSLRGLHVTGMVPGGPAARAGIRGTEFVHGDLITHANDVPIATFEELLHHVGGALAGSRVKLTVARDGRSREFDVTLGKYTRNHASLASVRPDPVFGLRIDWGGPLAMWSTPTPQGSDVLYGVSVREVAPNSPAAAAFKKAGDRPERWLVTHVNGAAVATPAEFYKATKGQPSVKLTLRDPTEPTPRDREVTLP
jgi:serine protease Do